MPQGWASQHAPLVWFLKVDCEATAPNQALARTKGIRCRRRLKTLMLAWSLGARHQISQLPPMRFEVHLNMQTYADRRMPWNHMSSVMSVVLPHVCSTPST